MATLPPQQAAALGKAREQLAAALHILDAGGHYLLAAQVSHVIDLLDDRLAPDRQRH